MARNVQSNTAFFRLQSLQCRHSLDTSVIDCLLHAFIMAWPAQYEDEETVTSEHRTFRVLAKGVVWRGVAWLGKARALTKGRQTARHANSPHYDLNQK